MKAEPRLADKFIAFVDVLGFKNMMESASLGGEALLAELYARLKLLGTEADRAHYLKYGPTMCPMAQRVRHDMDFYVTQVFDSVVVSAEVSPAGAVNLTHHCWRACFRLLSKGVMCRGYIKRGLIYHTEKNVFGPGHVEVVEKEKQISIFKQEADENATPFIEVDSSLVSYVAEQDDVCVREMFSRMVRTEGKLTAIFPFKSLQHSFIVGGIAGPFDPRKEKASNDNVRKMVTDLKDKIERYVDRSNTSAVSKAELYIRFLNDQLRVCDRTDEIIDQLMQPFPRARPH